MRVSDFASSTRASIERVVLRVGGRATPLAEIFSVASLPGENRRLVLEGDLKNFHRLGDGHSHGELVIEGHAGDCCACSMSGGTLRVAGDAGDFLAAPSGARRSGMSGGRVEVGGSAGDYAGHRMRRGEIFIEGDAGAFAASHQVAGTIAVAGTVGSGVGYGMRRGTLMATRLPALPPGRFSRPIQMRSVFPALIRPSAHWGEKTRRLVGALAREEFWASRGDAAVNGQGEVLALTREGCGAG